MNWRSPQTTYALDPYAPRGSVRTVSGLEPVRLRRHGHAQDLRAREAEAADAFTSAYIAVGPTQIYGPGRSIPGPYFVLPRV